MYFLFSGEGPTDMGNCRDEAMACQGEAYQHGPMAVVVDQIVAGWPCSSSKLRTFGFRECGTAWS